MSISTRERLSALFARSIFQQFQTWKPTWLRNIQAFSESWLLSGNTWSSPWQNKPQFSCDICLKSFSNKKSLQNHLGIHKGKTTCQICNTVFSTTSNLNFHMRKIHNLSELEWISIEFWSFSCTANYHGGANMKPDQEQLEFDEFVSQNTQKHTGGAKSIQCLLCSKVTIHVGNMKQHFEVHHFRRFYKCPVCHRDCKTRNCLSVHRKNYGHWVLHCTHTLENNVLLHPLINK